VPHNYYNARGYTYTHHCFVAVVIIQIDLCKRVAPSVKNCRILVWQGLTDDHMPLLIANSKHGLPIKHKKATIGFP